MDHVLVTGAAGFIGYHTCRKLISLGCKVTGLDNVNSYYDPALKIARLKQLGIDSNTLPDNKKINGEENFTFIKTDLYDAEAVHEIFKNGEFHIVVHLAAQAGVRYSLVKPQPYIDSNITGFLNILEGCRSFPLKHLVYASTSSVYGINSKLPFSVKDHTEHPASLYAASKKANELMAHSYSHLFGISCTGLRFFSVYGPWGRPDMALFLFTKNILKGEPIEVYNFGEMKRDFTFVDDIVDGIYAVMQKPAAPDPTWNSKDPDPSTSSAPYKIMNIGNQTPVNLLDFIKEIEICLDKKAVMKMLPMQPGDVPQNIADVTELAREYGYRPKTTVKEGVKRFVSWYLDYFGDR